MLLHALIWSKTLQQIFWRRFIYWYLFFPISAARIYIPQNLTHQMYPTNFINHPGGSFMSPVNPPAAQQVYQPMQLLAGQSPYMQNPFPCQGQVGYPPQLYQPQVPLNPWEADQERFGYLPQPYQPQLLQNPWDAGQGQFGRAFFNKMIESWSPKM